MCLVLFAILMMNMCPFKTHFSHYTDINIIFILLLASWHLSVVGMDIASIKKHDMTWLFYILTTVFGVFPLFNYICYYLVLDIQAQEVWI